MEEGDVASCQRKSRSPLQWPGIDENHHSGGEKHEEDLCREEPNVMEHISTNHMQPGQFSGKSYFICNDKNYVFEKFVRETMNRPDKSFPHKKYKKRGVRQKTFSEQVGVHGLWKVPCHTVTVIYDRTNYKVITAFPTTWWNNAKEIEGMERRSYNNEDSVYDDSLICAVIKERSNCYLMFQLYLWFRGS